MSKNHEMAHHRNMKSISVLKTLSLATLAIGIATPAFAQHCDVQNGDTMWHIAKRYHLDFKELCKMNMPHFKDLDVIFKGDEVHLPDQGSGGHSTNEHSQQDQIADGNNTTNERGESTQANEILQLVNQERSKQGLNPLTLSSELTKVANLKANDMKEKNYFSHDSPTYGSLKYEIPGFSEQWHYDALCVLLILVTSFLFSQHTKHIGGIIIPLEAAGLYAIGWLRYSGFAICMLVAVVIMALILFVERMDRD